MLAYLEAENAYADAVMAPLKPLQARLYEEIVARIKQDDSSVPVRDRGWWYYERFEKGQDYPVHERSHGGDHTDGVEDRHREAIAWTGRKAVAARNPKTLAKDHHN